MRDGALAFINGSKQMREQESREVVHREAQLMPVGAGPALRALRARSDPGIADEQIEPLVVGKHRLRKLTRP